MVQQYDRKAEDLGNITGLEHVNLQIPDQVQGNLFYIQGLGLTRDPYMNTGLANMWINVGKSQFHLPTGDPWVLRGAIGLVTPDRDALLARLDSVKKPLAGTYKEMAKRHLLTEESNAYQYRWETIVDPKTNKVLFEIEHEIRSMTHPLYARPLVNRNPTQSQQSYQMGGDAWDWELRRPNVRLPNVPPPSGPSAKAYAKRRETRMAGQAM